MNVLFSLEFKLMQPTALTHLNCPTFGKKNLEHLFVRRHNTILVIRAYDFCSGTDRHLLLNNNFAWKKFGMLMSAPRKQSSPCIIAG